MMPGLWTGTAILAGGMSPPSSCLHLLALSIRRASRQGPIVGSAIVNAQIKCLLFCRTWWIKKIRPLAAPYAPSFSLVVARQQQQPNVARHCQSPDG
ncbi:hypothetical protein BO99DRAFT_146943 [Aspergillus violaceofuscus CBS 115571]|uniref:Uncharacterized protein n=1 Tax=Aspergillus violaceofuscus (strain CBS 115571) TaxID=1450538 RepID=A0A2V5HBG5_ASPV1|nr:hypothetical protein BO99DRAFT_146943 [Aspergillus violaceofuscus CBS 115571]